MSDRLPTSALVQQLDLLIGGAGYNCYRLENQMRADDQLVRQRASGSLAAAAQALSALHLAYQQRYVPPCTRENPFPPAAELRRARAIVQLRERIEGLDAQVRGLSTPTQDRTWQRLRGEAALLQQLIAMDHQLINVANELEHRVLQLTPVTWKDGGEAAVEADLQAVEMAIRDRTRFLIASF